MAEMLGKRARGIWLRTGDTVNFFRNVAGHELTEEECDRLLNDEIILLEALYSKRRRRHYNAPCGLVPSPWTSPDGRQVMGAKAQLLFDKELKEAYAARATVVMDAIEPSSSTKVELSDEQQKFIDVAMSGKDIIVDACIGSGKTTAIQRLCDELMFSDKSVLYLTYNRLLKMDAKTRITNPNTLVQNYDGFAARELRREGIECPISELGETYAKVRPNLIDRFDVVVVDEYQDLKSEYADMLRHIRSQCPGVQFVCVGDMFQKIYDTTTLDVAAFMDEFLPDAMKMSFTYCFRLGADHAKWLGDIWGKEIEGVNPQINIRRLTFKQTFEMLSQAELSQILCLGGNKRKRDRMLNMLEREFPEKFNKFTVWSNTRANEDGGATVPSSDNAIFTTFDGCKGMERDICVVFDWTDDYWNVRLNQPNTDATILRNIFCVAASRGKREIVFVSDGLTEVDADKLRDSVMLSPSRGEYRISDMFSFKFAEDKARVLDFIDVEVVDEPGVELSIETHDGLIDISPCIGIMAEAVAFKNTDLDVYIHDVIHAKELGMEAEFDVTAYVQDIGLDEMSDESKVLLLTALETNQNRYIEQVSVPYLSDHQKTLLAERIHEHLPADVDTQIPCSIDDFANEGWLIEGYVDAVFDHDTLWELKFVSELSHDNELQCASYLVATGKPVGYLFNVRTGERRRITIKDRDGFVNAMIHCITKGKYAVESQYSADEYKRKFIDG